MNSIFFEFLIPFSIIFFIAYLLSEQIIHFFHEHTRKNREITHYEHHHIFALSIALSISLIAIIPHLLCYYPAQWNPILLINKSFLAIALFLAIGIILFLLTDKHYKNIYEKLRTPLLIISFIIAIYAILAYNRSYWPISSDFAPFVIGMCIFVMTVTFIKGKVQINNIKGEIL